MPVVKGTKTIYADFTKSKIKRTILKIDCTTTQPRLGMKFYALRNDSGIFQDACTTEAENARTRKGTHFFSLAANKDSFAGSACYHCHRFPPKMWRRSKKR